LPNRLTSPVASIALAVVASYRMNPIVGHAAVRTRTAACQHSREAPCASCQSRWREFPNMISSQDGTEDRRPRAVLRPGRAVWSPAA
jgi:hypothetical protein